MIVHIGTEIKSMFAVVDKEGNIVKQIPAQVVLQNVNLEEISKFVQDFQVLKKRLETENP